MISETADLNRILENIRDYAIFEMSLGGLVTYWNAGGERVTGFTAEEITGKSGHLIFTPEDRETGQPELEMRTALAHGSAEDERWHQRKDGSRFWGSGVLTCMLSQDSGEPTGFAKIVRDTTALRLTVERLRASEQRLRLLVENVRDSALLQIDLEGHIVYWNSGAERIFGYSPEEVTGRAWSLLFNPHDLKEEIAKTDLEQAEASGRSEWEWPMMRKDGTTFLAHWVTEPVRDDAGHLLGYVKLLRDQTQMKQAETRLRNSQRMEALGRLAGGVAHDFNNLLTIMSGYNSFIGQRLADRKELAPAIAQVQEAAQRAARLTAQLLAFSRRQVSQPTVISINDFLLGLEKMLRALLGEDIQLLLSLTPEAGNVRADAAQMEQIVLNLAANARDAMPAGGTLRITSGRCEAEEIRDSMAVTLPPGSYVTARITDTGHGIDPATLSHIFEPFFTTKPHDKGTGLGLATSYGIAQQSGGTLTAESVPAAGSAFTLYLPLVAAEAPPTDRNPNESPSTGGSETILVVEDEPALRQLFRQTLAEAGYTVLEASDGVDAIRVAAIAQTAIDLLITDVVMPRLDGTEVAVELRKQRPDLPVVFISGFTNQALESRGVLREGVRLLQKPFLPEVLLKAVEAALADCRPLVI